MSVPDEPETTGAPNLPRRYAPGPEPLFAGGDDRPDAYELLGDGFRGGQGVTWRALDHLMSAPVLCAVKALPLPSAAELNRLEQRKRLLQHLALPNVVRVLDLMTGPAPHPRGRTDRAAPRVLYVVMEWIDGPTLLEYAGGRPATRSTLLERLRYVCQLAAALTGLTKAGGNAVLHRDVKPGNCVIHHRRGLVLIDVTTLRPVDDGFDPEGLHTPGYAAPEVQSAPRRARTVASELYALGAVAAFCLTGESPTGEDRPAELLAVAAEAGVPDPEAFVRHLLAARRLDPGERPTDPWAWSEELVRLAIRPPAPAAVPARPRATRRRWLAGAALAGLLAAGAGVAVAARPDRHTESPPAKAAPTAAPATTGMLPGTTAAAPPATSPAATTSPAIGKPAGRTPTARATTKPPEPAVVARGIITSPGEGTDVKTCSYFLGTATLPPETTLILTKRNLDNPGAGVYAELVHGWDKPGTLDGWEGAQYFGQGDDSSGQTYEVGLRVVPMRAARDFAEQDRDITGEGEELDTIRVKRVAGDAGTACEGRS